MKGELKKLDTTPTKPDNDPAKNGLVEKMEDRIVIALGLLAAMLAGGTWLVIARIRARRAFEYRQSGRGKGLD
ncbi:hypothetical protein ACFSAG_13825 [Sphingorhabdus buctiana]|uniref:Uncharacterized protein n=1 Tax=Sphingorhabdus buctiana TaxID=1508805 RepID=A0ABW4MHU6_9SPHN